MAGRVGNGTASCLTTLRREPTSWTDGTRGGRRNAPRSIGATPFAIEAEAKPESPGADRRRGSSNLRRDRATKTPSTDPAPDGASGDENASHAQGPTNRTTTPVSFRPPVGRTVRSLRVEPESDGASPSTMRERELEPEIESLQRTSKTALFDLGEDQGAPGGASPLDYRSRISFQLPTAPNTSSPIDIRA